ncbi:Na+/H+ antiporter subunit G [Halomonas cupida]|uniref:Monovalent cation/H+ antiporter subunit G n=1 Tax=Halomonas cupida TaxID=44933 RepID=A0A1M7HDM3_9GAMM|nr:Na+/H+ antiporter subunit G [Halomonas cupida]GEN25502.1 monovalent cation/H+ antiporter subunit G [Halomonas cupida]SHM26565.1 multisubunit potassium/proton antiporter, PhaG subunit (TC 2.A.63.1.1) [Halomonas cupida]
MFYVILEGLISALLIAGGLFAFIGSLGMAHLRDFFMRLHGPTKATTLGIGSILIASIIYFSIIGGGTHLQELLITIFLFITAPVSAHLLAKTGLHQRLKYLDKTRGKPVELLEEEQAETPVMHSPNRE